MAISNSLGPILTHYPQKNCKMSAFGTSKITWIADKENNNSKRVVYLVDNLDFHIDKVIEGHKIMLQWMGRGNGWVGGIGHNLCPTEWCTMAPKFEWSQIEKREIRKKMRKNLPREWKKVGEMDMVGVRGEHQQKCWEGQENPRLLMCVMAQSENKGFWMTSLCG